MPTPQYYFVVKDIKLSAGQPELPPGSNWDPPKEHGSHVLAPERSVTGGVAAFSCDGLNLVPLEPVPPVELPSEEAETHFKTATVYYYNEGFHIIDYDATAAPVGDAHPEEGSPTAPPSRRYMGWRPLSFDRHDRQENYYSYATFSGSHTRLYAQRADQRWPHIILPLSCHASPNRRLAQRDHPLAGLIGELPLILALVALSTDPTRLRETFATSFREGRWNLQDLPYRRENFRGVVVSVHANQMLHAALEDYERGRGGYGAVLP